jgi:SOS-response transcriptional repressor LexA
MYQYGRYQVKRKFARGHLPKRSKCGLIVIMGIYETRRANLRWLIDHQYEGVAANLAKDLRIQASQLSRIFSPNPKNQRNIGTKLARAIEQVTRKPVGWMDEPHRFEEGKSEAAVPSKGVLVMFPGNKIVPILDYTQAWQWTESSEPYPITDRTEVIWTSLDQLSDRTFGLVIEGESMAEEFYPSEIVIVDPEITPNPGDYVVAKLNKDDKVIFRKYRLRGPNEAGKPAIELAPLNENYATSVIDSKNPGRIIGTMVEHRKFRRTDRLSAPAYTTLRLGKP